MDRARSPGWRRARAALASLLALALTGCEPEAAPAPAGPPLRIAAYYWPGMYWIDIAEARGWLRDAGLAVQRVDTNADYFAGLDRVASGELDLGGFTLYDFVRYNAVGKSLVAVLTLDYSTGAEGLAAGPGIARIADLAGRRVGVARGTYLEYLWLRACASEGVDPRRAEIVDVPAEQAVAALKEQRADAVFTWEPLLSEAAAAVGGRTLWDSSRVPRVMSSVLAGRPALLRERTDEVQKLLGVWQRATRFLREQPDAALAIVADANKVTVADARAFMARDRVLELSDNLAMFEFAGGNESLHGSARLVADFIGRSTPAAAQLDTAKLFDARFVRRLTAADAHR